MTTAIYYYILLSFLTFCGFINDLLWGGCLFFIKLLLLRLCLYFILFALQKFFFCFLILSNLLKFRQEKDTQVNLPSFCLLATLDGHKYRCFVRFSWYYLSLVVLNVNDEPELVVDLLKSKVGPSKIFYEFRGHIILQANSLKN